MGGGRGYLVCFLNLPRTRSASNALTSKGNIEWLRFVEGLTVHSVSSTSKLLGLIRPDELVGRGVAMRIKS